VSWINNRYFSSDPKSKLIAELIKKQIQIEAEGTEIEKTEQEALCIATDSEAAMMTTISFWQN
jgi:hypothetical protein